MKLVLLWVGLAFSALVFAQGTPGDLSNVEATSDMTPEDQAEFRDIAEMLRCPTCQGLSVLESDAAFSLQIQARVKEQLATGKSRDEILNFFRERYGKWILREPPKEGVDLLAWIFPVALLCLGPLGVWFFVWRRQQTVSTGDVRSREDLLAEFEVMLTQVRQQKGN